MIHHTKHNKLYISRQSATFNTIKFTCRSEEETNKRIVTIMWELKKNYVNNISENWK